MGEFDSETNENNIISKSKFYDEYIDFCKKMNINWRDIQSVFGRNLVKYCDLDVTQRTGSDQRRYRCYQFPSKDDCRKQFEKHAGLKIDWESERNKKRKNEVDKI